MAHHRALSVGRGLFFIAFAATAWGVGGFVAALLYRTSGLGPIAVSFWRFVGGVALLVAFRPLTTGARRSGVCGGVAGQSSTTGGTAWRAGTRRVVLTGVGFAVYQTAYYAAIHLTGLAIGTVVTLGAGPVLIAVGARLFLGERLGPRGLATVAASLVGLVLLAGPREAGASWAGIAAALLSALGYAGVTLFSRAHRSDGNALDSALGGFAVGATCLLPLAAVQGLLPSTSHVGGTVGLLAFLGAVPTALAYAMFFAGLTAVRATTAAVVALVEPLAAAVLGVAVLGEHLTRIAWLGAAILLASVALLVRAEAG